MLDSGIQKPLIQFRTRGSDLVWSNIEEWVTCAWRLHHRRPSRARHQQIHAHWHGLPIGMVYTCHDDDALASVLTVAESLHCKPLRGARGGSHWEAIHMAVSNRRKQLATLENSRTIGAGHNSRRRVDPCKVHRPGHA